MRCSVDNVLDREIEAVDEAHNGTQREHGGVVQIVGGMSCELVTRSDGVEPYSPKWVQTSP